MRTYLGLLSTLTMGAAVLATTSSARAESFSLHIEPGVAIPLNEPQDLIYNPGPALAAKGLFALHPNFALGPSVQAMYLPRAKDNGQNAGVLWQGGLALRVQGNRSIPDGPQGWEGWSRWSPWLDVDAMVAHTGTLWRPAFDVAIGEEIATDREHAAWMGPFVRYTHVFQSADREGSSLLDKRDVNILQAGWSFSFDFPVKPHQVTHTVVRDYYHESVVTVPVVQKVVVAAPDKVDFSEHVYFDWDKDTLRWESRDKLDAVAQKLLTHPNSTINVQGHASADGQLVHNEVLASKRAAAVFNYLVSKGVPAARLQVESFGVDRPAADNKVQEGRERSRRVEFEVHFTSK